MNGSILRELVGNEVLTASLEVVSPEFATKAVNVRLHSTCQIIKPYGDHAGQAKLLRRQSGAWPER